LIRVTVLRLALAGPNRSSRRRRPPLGAAVRSAGTASVTASSVGADLDLAGALAMARELGAVGWAAAELLTALRLGLAEGAALRGRESVPSETEVSITPRAS
jgi:hypothetical protein